MSHVDDGTLHAYLDGELSALEVARLEGHLIECAPCRARLAEETDVVARAGRILALAEPPAPERAAPPLHQLRHPRPQWRVRVPLAWAASLVLVAGATWFTLKPDGALQRPEPEADAFRGLAEAESDSASSPAPAASQDELRLHQPLTDVAVRGEPPAGQAPSPAAPLADVAARRAAPAADSVSPRAQAPARTLDTTRQVASLQANRADTTPTRDSLPVVTLDGIQIRGAAPTAAVQSVPSTASSNRYGYATPVASVELDSARALLGADVLAIDRVPIESIRRVGAGMIVVEQRLPSGELIQLRQQVAVAGKATVSLRLGPQQIAGRVTDAASGAPMANARVQATGTTLGATTDARGAFVIDSVTPGAYRLRAQMIGYEPVDLSAARVDSGRTTSVDFALRPAAQQLSEVVVTGAAARERLRREAAPATAAAAPTAPLWRQVGRLRVEISGSLPADSLGKLLENVKPIR